MAASKPIVCVCIMSFIWVVANSEYDPCMSALSLENDGTTKEGVYVFITPAARVAQGTLLNFLCCGYSSDTGLSPPWWTFSPEGSFSSGISIEGNSRRNGYTLHYNAFNATAASSDNNTEVDCTFSTGDTRYLSDFTRIIVLGKTIVNQKSENKNDTIWYLNHHDRSPLTSQTCVGVTC